VTRHTVPAHPDGDKTVGGRDRGSLGSARMRPSVDQLGEIAWFRQSVNQALATLTQRGIVEAIGRGVYEVRDRAALVALARGGPAPGPGSRGRGVVGSARAPDA
jgi:hypothetical protein